ncbi:hypothetical protein HDU85_006423 [Gaertneriomyces sp. JEL0708]|nr:hypothetical protein HDU85_006423 [Gaertneriomyces sp. JEL0708]
MANTLIFVTAGKRKVTNPPAASASKKKKGPAVGIDQAGEAAKSAGTAAALQINSFDVEQSAAFSNPLAVEHLAIHSVVDEEELKLIECTRDTFVAIVEDLRVDERFMEVAKQALSTATEEGLVGKFRKRFHRTMTKRKRVITSDSEESNADVFAPRTFLSPPTVPPQSSPTYSTHSSGGGASENEEQVDVVLRRIGALIAVARANPPQPLRLGDVDVIALLLRAQERAKKRLPKMSENLMCATAAYLTGYSCLYLPQQRPDFYEGLISDAEYSTIRQYFASRMLIVPLPTEAQELAAVTSTLAEMRGRKECGLEWWLAGVDQDDADSVRLNTCLRKMFEALTTIKPRKVVENA